jgi:hypothetical protein
MYGVRGPDKIQNTVQLRIVFISSHSYEPRSNLSSSHSEIRIIYYLGSYCDPGTDKCVLIGCGGVWGSVGLTRCKLMLNARCSYVRCNSLFPHYSFSVMWLFSLIVFTSNSTGNYPA